MKIIAALVTVLSLVGFGSVAFADCAGHAKGGETAQTNGKIVPPADQTS